MPESSISFRSLGELPGRISDGKPPEARSLVQNSGAVLLMRRWYLSYNSQDLALMQGLEGALKRKDPDASIFLAPKSLRVGGFWLPELARQIAESTAFVLLVGERGLGPWQIIEYYEALDRRVKQHDFPVVLVLLDGRPAPGLPFLRQLHWIIAADPASEKSIAQVMDAASGGGRGQSELWRHTAPYRGLAAMTESDTDFFFGRGRETGEVIGVLAAAADKLPVLLGNSGVGKSSVAQAGVLAAFTRQAWPGFAETTGVWPPVFNDSRRWYVLKIKPGTEPVRALVEPFIRTWQFDPTDPRRETRQTEWIQNLIQGRGTLRGLLDATEDRSQQEEPTAFLLYIDQGEELYVRGDERQRHCFSKIVAEGLADPRLRALMSMRADFFGELQRDEPLYAVHRLINVPPLRETELREVVSRPAELLSARFETDRLGTSIAQRTAEESTKDAGALPLLSYLLDDMWRQMIQRDDGVLRLPEQAIELGAVLVDRANSFLANHPKSENQLRRIFTLKLATVLEDGEPNRRRALRSEFSDEEWRLVSELADHPNRLLVTATPEVGESYAEVAHEAIFRRWDKLREWIGAERQFLVWRSGLEAARRAWEATPDGFKNDALLMGLALANAQSWRAKRSDEIPKADRTFILQSGKMAQRRRLRVQALVGAFVAVMVAGLAAWWNQGWLKEHIYAVANVTALKRAQERALKPRDAFKECTDCPEMIVVPAGLFTMGSPSNETVRWNAEGPQHDVTIAKPFAVSKFELTFAEWDACVAYGDCVPHVPDNGFGRGRQPVIFVSWDDAQSYVAWLSRVTGRPYRLLTEAEYEYAARAGTQTAYPWGDEIGKNNANCDGCGTQWDRKQPAPVASFAANQFGLYDMVGNVWEWVEDCFHPHYDGAPADGSAWPADNCSHRVVRGGAWGAVPRFLRSAQRVWWAPGHRSWDVGFRVGRTLDALSMTRLPPGSER
jgi:formylglycine-generating enzyme required for sulfatase activity